MHPVLGNRGYQLMTLPLQIRAGPIVIVKGLWLKYPFTHTPLVIFSVKTCMMTMQPTDRIPSLLLI